MSKQTAVEYLLININEYVKLFDIDKNKRILLLQAIKTAYQMEKEQIMEAHGDERDYLSDSGNFITISAEQYYNETYKKEEK